MFASPDRHGVASTRSHPQQEQQQQHRAGSQQHPLTHLFAEDRCRLPNISTTLQLRASAACFRDAFSSTQLRSRVSHSVGRGGIGTQLLRFDPSLEMGDLMAAVWIAEEGGPWDETREVLQWASQCGFCQLPINLTADDINTHPNKTAYRSVARVLAQLMVVGRHVDFGDGSRLQIFRHDNGEVRAIKDEPGFRLAVNPPLAAHHLYQQHRLQHDPPVRSRIYSPLINRLVSWDPYTDASSSSFAKKMIFHHFYWTHQINDTFDYLRYVGGGRVDGLLTQSPHTPVAGCTTTLSREDDIGDERQLVLTDDSHNFIAWIRIGGSLMGDVDDLDVCVQTTEAPVCASGAFKDRFPVTTRLARVA
ncbi:unnamed protein product [Vitrella brassicaformis CCMP3155]|uniref:Uncharacterized protein n=1 Tax=Vitrella brassicaformis (strain CCMP3155) TaxID=1169540 RepID=A0A0G4H3G3_VITBC|nr:unnamed protein product [Vitrella brassicaformis CCMP3155]|eukprot:CEM38243.1 unnamed protein product [Vitrella brassicaformis CCMP3155]